MTASSPTRRTQALEYSGVSSRGTADEWREDVLGHDDGGGDDDHGGGGEGNSHRAPCACCCSVIYDASGRACSNSLRPERVQYMLQNRSRTRHKSIEIIAF